MAEVIYEIKDNVTYIVGSEETEPGDGYTYNDLLAPLIAKPTMGPAELAKLTVDAYSDHYKNRGEGSTQSYVRGEKVNEFLKLVNDFAYAASQSGEKQVIKDAVNQAQSYAIAENKDFYHFVSIVVGKTQNADVKAKGQALMTFIKDKLVAHSRHTDSEGGWWGPVSYENSYGVSVYLPSSGMGAGYDELAWSKYSNWDEFIRWYQNSEQRQIKGGGGIVGVVVEACISWAVGKVCDYLWDEIKKQNVEVCREVKTCEEYSSNSGSSSDSGGTIITPSQEYEVENNLQKSK